MVSVYKMGKELTDNDSNVILNNFGLNAVQNDFKTLKFISISMLYL